MVVKFLVIASCLLIISSIACKPTNIAQNREPNDSVIKRANSYSAQEIKAIRFEFVLENNSTERFKTGIVRDLSSIAKIRSAFLQASRTHGQEVEPEIATEAGSRVAFVPVKGEEVSFEIVESDLDDSWGPEVARVMRHYRKVFVNP